MITCGTQTCFFGDKADGFATIHKILDITNLYYQDHKLHNNGINNMLNFKSTSECN